MCRFINARLEKVMDITLQCGNQSCFGDHKRVCKRSDAVKKTKYHLEKCEFFESYGKRRKSGEWAK